jgi:beta-D-xylosidase 4
LGNYFGVTAGVVTPLLGLQAEFTNVSFMQVLADVRDVDATKIRKAEETLRQIDPRVVVIVVGLDQKEEAEGHDRVRLNLPGAQQELVDSVAKVAKGMKDRKTTK